MSSGFRPQTPKPSSPQTLEPQTLKYMYVPGRGVLE